MVDSLQVLRDLPELVDLALLLFPERSCDLGEAMIEVVLDQAVDLATHTFFIGEIKTVWADEAIAADGRIAVEKWNPLLLTMPDNRYWTLGNQVADAWSVGKALKKGEAQ